MPRNDELNRRVARFRLRFGLRTLLLVVTVAGVSFGLLGIATQDVQDEGADFGQAADHG